MTSKELRQKLGELHDEYKKLIDVGHEKRTAEQNASMDRMEADFKKLEAEITRVDEHEKRELRLNEPANRGQREDPAGADPAKGKEGAEKRAIEFRNRWSHLKGGLAIAAEHLAAGITGELRGPDGKLIQNAADRSTPEYRRAFLHYLQVGRRSLTAEEERALSVGTDTAGGYTVPLEDFAMRLIVRLTEQNVIRGLATQQTVAQAQTLGIPAISADPADADWTVEIGTGSEDSTMAVSKRELRPWPLAKRIKVSEKLLRASPLGAEAIVRERLAIIVGRAQAKAFNTGDAVNKPLGIYTPNANGIPVGQDQAIWTTSAPDADKVISGFYALRPVYLPTARFHFHQNTLAAFRKMKTTNPIAYLWQPGLALGAPSTFLGVPYVIDEYAPSTVAQGAGNYAAVCGDFSYYQIVDALDMRIQRLEELYAETGQVGFIVRAETDAQPVLGEAFVRFLYN